MRRRAYTHYGPYFRAWRQCYFAPGLLHLLCGVLILFYGQDGPNGNQDDVVVGNKKGVSKDEARRNFLYGVMNYRMWIFTITYGFCFGVELVVDNILGDYYYSQACCARGDSARRAQQLHARQLRARQLHARLRALQLHAQPGCARRRALWRLTRSSLLPSAVQHEPD